MNGPHRVLEITYFPLIYRLRRVIVKEKHLDKFCLLDLKHSYLVSEKQKQTGVFKTKWQ